MLVDSNLNSPILLRNGKEFNGGTVIEISKKTGSFDGALRTRITFRREKPGMKNNCTCAPAILNLEKTESIHLKVQTHAGGIPNVVWEEIHDLLRWKKDEELPTRKIVGWHGKHFFNFYLPK